MRLILILLIHLILDSATYAQSFYSLIVYVCDNESKRPIPDALVIITEAGLISKNTGTDGMVFFDKSIPVGEIHYTIAKEGFIAQEATFNITTEQKSNTLTIKLEKVKPKTPVTHTDSIPQPKGDYNTTVVGDQNIVFGGQGYNVIVEHPDIPKFTLLEVKMDTGIFLGNGRDNTPKSEFKYRYKVKFNFQSDFSKNKLAFKYDTTDLFDIGVLPVVGQSAVLFRGAGGIIDRHGNRKTDSIASPTGGDYELVILIQNPQSNLLERILIQVDDKKIFQFKTSK